MELHALYEMVYPFCINTLLMTRSLAYVCTSVKLQEFEHIRQKQLVFKLPEGLVRRFIPPLGYPILNESDKGLATLVKSGRKQRW